VAAFEQVHTDDGMAAEADFPAALAEFRTAIAAASAAGIPPARPSATPDAAVGAAWVWLAEMYLRTAEGHSPTSGAEFAELAAWFEENERRLYTEVGQVLDWGTVRGCQSRTCGTTSSAGHGRIGPVRLLAGSVE
jgi:hypothetical protein